nr:translation initiation factor IF-2-like [Aegilops tauschii subsp. strangulata]
MTRPAGSAPALSANPDGGLGRLRLLHEQRRLAHSAGSPLPAGIRPRTRPPPRAGSACSPPRASGSSPQARSRPASPAPSRRVTGAPASGFIPLRPARRAPVAASLQLAPPADLPHPGRASADSPSARANSRSASRAPAGSMRPRVCPAGSPRPPVAASASRPRPPAHFGRLPQSPRPPVAASASAHGRLRPRSRAGCAGPGRLRPPPRPVADPRSPVTLRPHSLLPSAVTAATVAARRVAPLLTGRACAARSPVIARPAAPDAVCARRCLARLSPSSAMLAP